jgi:hypothetical protein
VCFPKIPSGWIRLGSAKGMLTLIEERTGMHHEDFNQGE